MTLRYENEDNDFYCPINESEENKSMDNYVFTHFVINDCCWYKLCDIQLYVNVVLPCYVEYIWQDWLVGIERYYVKNE